MSIIVPGYKGIIDLDLTHIDKRLYSEMKRQHEEDIEEYKKEQDALPEKLKYENTVVRAENILKMDEQIMKRKKQIFLEKQKKEDEANYERFLKNEEKRIKSSRLNQ